jgi:hypothetical protein
VRALPDTRGLAVQVLNFARQGIQWINQGCVLNRCVLRWADVRSLYKQKPAAVAIVVDVLQ